MSDHLESTGHSWQPTATAIEMAISGFVGLIAAFVLSIEAWQLASDSSATFGCDVNSVISCSTVALTPQARVLGFPNAFLGIFFEAIVLAISVALAAGARFPRWYMLGAELLYTIALGFAYWLFIQSYFVIGALCPWCLLITATTTLVWWGLTRINMMFGHIPAHEGLRRIIDRGLDWPFAGVVIFILAGMIVAKYGHTLF